jgi:hypothetical protein
MACLLRRFSLLPRVFEDRTSQCGANVVLRPLFSRAHAIAGHAVEINVFFTFSVVKTGAPDFRYHEPESSNTLIFCEKRQPAKPFRSIRVRMAPRRVKKKPRNSSGLFSYGTRRSPESSATQAECNDENDTACDETGLRHAFVRNKAVYTIDHQNLFRIFQSDPVSRSAPASAGARHTPPQRKPYFLQIL